MNENTLSNKLNRVDTAVNTIKENWNIEQEASIESVVETIGDGSYAPRRITFTNYTGTELDYELSKLDTKNLISFKNIFDNCNQLTQLDVSKFKSDNIEDFTSMFSNCSKLVNIIGLDNWNMSKATQIYGMFSSCSSLQSLDLNNWDVSKITSAAYLFSGCKELTDLDLSNWKMDSLYTPNYIMPYCSKLKNVKIFEWTWHYRTPSFQNAFTDCSSLTSLDLSKWHCEGTSITMSAAFSGCTSLQYLDLRNIDFSRSSKYTNAFTGVPNNCLVIVKNDASKNWVLNCNSAFTNVKTLEEYIAEGGE